MFKKEGKLFPKKIGVFFSFLMVSKSYAEEIKSLLPESTSKIYSNSGINMIKDQSLFPKLSEKEKALILNPCYNVKIIIKQMAQDPEFHSRKILNIIECSEKRYHRLQAECQINKERIQSHKLWITGKENKATEIPGDSLLNLVDFVNGFSKWDHFLWVLNKQDIPQTIKVISEKLPNVQIREVRELRNFRGKALFDYFLKNNFYCFASNVARFNVLYENGGLYSDIGWSIEKESKHLFDLYETILLPNYAMKSNFFDVWCAFFKKNSPILLKHLKYLESYEQISLFAEKKTSPEAADLFCVAPFTAFAYEGLSLNDNVLIAPEFGVFIKNRLNSWGQKPKFNNKSSKELPPKLELINTIFPLSHRIANIGFFNQSNSGDDLFNTIFKKFLYPFHIEQIPFSSLNQPKNLFNNYNTYLIGGGDLIDFSFSNSIYLPKEILKQDSQVFICGVGVHNQHRLNPYAALNLGKFLEAPNVQMMTVRDLKSQKALSETLGLKNVQQFPDLVFSLDLPYETPIKERHKIAIIPREMGQGGYDLSEKDFEILSKTVIEPLLESGHNVQVISMRKLQKEYDAVNKFFLKPYQEVLYLPYETPDRNISDIQSCDALISMRYHGIILGAMLGKPVIGLEFSDKFKGLEDIFDRSDMITKANDPDLLRKVLTVSPVSYEKIKFLRQESRKQLEILKSMLEEKSFKEDVEN